MGEKWSIAQKHNGPATFYKSIIGSNLASMHNKATYIASYIASYIDMLSCMQLCGYTSNLLMKSTVASCVHATRHSHQFKISKLPLSSINAPFYRPSYLPTWSK